MLEVPHTHPMRLLSQECEKVHRASGGGTQQQHAADACKERLTARLNLTLAHELLSLNDTATFRAPLRGAAAPRRDRICLG